MKKAKKYTTYLAMGYTLMVQGITCLVLFAVTLKEKKSLSEAFFALALSFGATAAALFTLYNEYNNEEIRRHKMRIAKNDSWYYSFEDKKCEEPDVTIIPDYTGKVETEDDDILKF